MTESKIKLLERALEKERIAREEAERILEEKERELLQLQDKLKSSDAPKSFSKKIKPARASGIEDAYVKFDLKGNLLEINRAAEEVFGTDSLEEYPNVFDIIYRDDLGLSMKAFENLLKQGSVQDVVVRFYSKNFPIKIVSATAKLIYNDNKEAIAAEGFIKDITDISKLHEWVVKREEQLNLILENAPFGILLTENGKIRRTNKVFEEIVGYSKRELLNIDANSLARPENYEEVQRIRKDLDDGKKYVDFESSLVRDGALVKLKIGIANIIPERNEPNFRVTFMEDITKEAKRQEEFEEQSKQLELIVENSPVGIALSDGNGLVKVNRKYQSLLGYSEDELRSMTFQDYTFQEDIEYNLELLQSLHNGKADQFSIKKRYVKKDGTLMQAKTTVGAIRDTTGEIKNEVVIIEDITEELRRQREINTQAKQLELIVENSPMGIALSNSNGLMKVNKKYQKLIGYTEDELRGMNFKDYTHADDVEASRQWLEKLYNGEVDHFTISKRYIHKDGSLLTARTTVGAIREEDGSIEYEVVLIEDITQESQRQKEFEQQRKELEAIVNNSPLGICLAANGQITKVNPAFCELLGFEEDELKGINIEDITHEDDKSKARIKSDELSRGEIEKFVINKRYIRKDGSALHARSNVSAVGDTNTNPQFTIRIIEDISDQIKSQRLREELMDKLEKQNNELQEYAHVVSHDLKSPLRNISTLTNWIKTDMADVSDHEGFQHVDLIEKNVEKMENLINGILTYSNVEKGQVVTERFSLNSLLKDVVELLEIPNHIEVKIDDAIPAITGDLIRFQQLFQNLISNAVKSIEKQKGLVEIGFKEQKTSVVFFVRDNGVGIPKEYHSRIFRIFESLDENDTESTGIGLSIVRKIVESYKGSIKLESEVGKGTTFFIKLRKNAIGI